jgi:hypothetical protein
VQTRYHKESQALAHSITQVLACLSHTSSHLITHGPHHTAPGHTSATTCLNLSASSPTCMCVTPVSHMSAKHMCGASQAGML